MRSSLTRPGHFTTTPTETLATQIEVHVRRHADARACPEHATQPKVGQRRRVRWMATDPASALPAHEVVEVYAEVVLDVDAAGRLPRSRRAAAATSTPAVSLDRRRRAAAGSCAAVQSPRRRMSCRKRCCASTADSGRGRTSRFCRLKVYMRTQGDTTARIVAMGHGRVTHAQLLADGTHVSASRPVHGQPRRHAVELRHRHRSRLPRIVGFLSSQTKAARPAAAPS